MKIFYRLSNSPTLKGRAIVLGRWKFVWHKTIGSKGKGRNISVWHYKKETE